MKIFVSCSAADREVADALQLKLESSGHQILSADAVDPGEDITQSITAMLADADAFVFIIPSAWKDNAWLMWEWRMALARTWEGPDRPLVGVVSGDADPPPFLQGRPLVRIAGGADLEAGMIRVFELLNLPGDLPSDPSEDLKVHVREQMGKVSQEIAKFHLSKEDLQEQRQWIVDKVERIARVKPDSVDVAKLQIKLADIFKALGNETEAVSALERGLDILERHDGVPAIKRAQVKARLARTMNKLGNLEGEKGGKS